MLVMVICDWLDEAPLPLPLANKSIKRTRSMQQDQSLSATKMRTLHILFVLVTHSIAMASGVLEESLEAIKDFEETTSSINSPCYTPEIAAFIKESDDKVAALSKDAVQNLLAAQSETDPEKRVQELTRVIDDAGEIIKVIEGLFITEYENVVRPPCDVSSFTCSQKTIFELVTKLTAEERLIAQDEKDVFKARTPEECTRIGERLRKDNYDVICDLQKLISVLQDCVAKQ